MPSGFPVRRLSAGHHPNYTNLQDSVLLLENEWYAISATYNHSTKMMHLYKNGQQVDKKPNVEDCGDQSDVLVGAYNTNNGYKFQGLIDQIRIYDRALSGAEIFQLYNSDLLIADTDGDGYSDVIEQDQGSDPDDNSSFPGTDYRNGVFNPNAYRLNYDFGNIEIILKTDGSVSSVQVLKELILVVIKV